MDFIDLLRSAWLVLVCGAAYAAVFFRRVVLGQKHPLDWPVDIEMLAAGFKVSLEWGNLATLRLLLGVMANPALHSGLNIEKLQPPGCEPCYWLSLKHLNSRNSSSRDHDDNDRQQQSSQQPDIVLCYVHGGAFVAGHPLMCAGTFKRWMEALDRQGLHTQVLCISYPLAPERPFPAAVASTAAVFAWVGRQFPAGCGTTVIALGDSAGGNIVPTSLAALRDYMQHKGPAPLHQMPVVGIAAAPQHDLHGAVGAPAGDAKHAAAAATIGSSPLQASNSSNGTGNGSSDDCAAAVAAVSSNGSHAAALTAAIEAHLFADLHNRLTVMAASSSTSSAANTADSLSNSTLTPHLTAAAASVRMPSAIILVSPATDISPTACFRTHWPPVAAGSSSDSSSDACDLSSSTAQPAQAPAPDPSTAAAGSSSKRPHYDYLPENIESGGMGSYAAHHEQLCGPYASPVHLPSLQGLTQGRWLLLSGGVELLHPDIDRFAKKLQSSLGSESVVFHTEPHLPHSWAILPNPSMAGRQEVVVRFIAAEHAAHVAAVEQPGHGVADA